MIFPNCSQYLFHYWRTTTITSVINERTQFPMHINGSHPSEIWENDWIFFHSLEQYVLWLDRGDPSWLEKWHALVLHNMPPKHHYWQPPWLEQKPKAYFPSMMTWQKRLDRQLKKINTISPLETRYKTEIVLSFQLPTDSLVLLSFANVQLYLRQKRVPGIAPNHEAAQSRIQDWTVLVSRYPQPKSLVQQGSKQASKQLKRNIPVL